MSGREQWNSCTPTPTKTHNARSSGAELIYKIVKSPYAGFDIVAIEPELYTDVLEGELVDGMPSFSPLGTALPRRFGT